MIFIWPLIAGKKLLIFFLTGLLLNIITIYIASMCRSNVLIVISLVLLISSVLFVTLSNCILFAMRRNLHTIEDTIE